VSEPLLTIRDIEAIAVDAPLARPITTASGAIPSAPLVLITVMTAQGVAGRAYIFGYSAVTLRPLVALFAELAGMLRGQAVAPVERMRQFTGAFRLLGRQGLLGMAISGLDMAFWDALGRARGVSVARLLGGEERPQPAYDSYGLVDPERDRAELEQSRERGFRAIKIKLGCGDLQHDVDTVRGVRAIIGDSTGLMVDYNQSLTVPEAMRRINRLAEFDLLWVEEPVPAEDLAGHAAVREACDPAIQTGENWWFPEDAARAIAMKASDFVMLDLMKIGGVTGWLRAAAQAEGASLPVSSHLFLEASAHVLAVTLGAHFLEHLDLAGAVLRDPPKLAGGVLAPRGPGLGLEWDDDAVARYAL
jgi:mandelate racemase